MCAGEVVVGRCTSHQRKIQICFEKMRVCGSGKTKSELLDFWTLVIDIESKMDLDIYCFSPRNVFFIPKI